MTVKARTPEVLEVEAHYGPNGRPPPKHWHPAQDEHFQVLEGRIRVRTPERDGTLGEGERIEIPSGTLHQMWNPGTHRARVLWQTRPAGRTESWFRSLARLLEEGRVGRSGMPTPLAIAPLLSEYDDVIRFSLGPGFITRGAIAALAPLGRMRGVTP